MKKMTYLVMLVLMVSLVSCISEKEKESGMCPWVDMGLSVKWALCNVGAHAPEEAGAFFAWGEVEVKDHYTLENSVTTGQNLSDFAGQPQYDAAAFHWKWSSRLPMRCEVEELLSHTTQEWGSCNGVNGFWLTSKINKSRIFLPAAGYPADSLILNDNRMGYYWTSTPVGGSKEEAYEFGFDRDSLSLRNYYRSYGRSVRAVCPVCTDCP